MALLAATGVIEKLEGRTLFGSAKKLKLWTSETDGPLTSQTVMDPYSFTHIEHGLIFNAVLTSLGIRQPAFWAMLIESAWEVAENSNWGIKKYRTSGYTYAGDSIVNSLADIVFMWIGYSLASAYLTPVHSVMLAAAIDGVLYLTYNDSLVQTFVKFITAK